MENKERRKFKKEFKMFKVANKLYFYRFNNIYMI